jgi:hypothetical protein
MPNDENDVEKYLKEFRARAVRPLEIIRPKTSAWTRRLAAAAILAVLAGGGTWIVVHSHKVQSVANPTVEHKTENNVGAAGKKLPMLQMTKLAVEDPEKLEALLGKAPRKDLSVLDGTKSMLGTLAKE